MDGGAWIADFRGARVWRSEGGGAARRLEAMQCARVWNEPPAARYRNQRVRGNIRKTVLRCALVYIYEEQGEGYSKC